MTPREFIDRLTPGALECERKLGIPAAFTIAQAALESGWGESKLTRDANNLFGIKAHGWPGETYEIATAEYVNGERVMETASFRKYGSWEASLLDHGKFLSENRRYAAAFNETTPEGWARAVAAAGYATDPQYSAKLITLMRNHRLDAIRAGEPAPAPIEESQPTWTAPKPSQEEPPMAPILTSVLPAIAGELLKILPWYSSGSPTSDRNIRAAQQIGPVLIDLAKQASGQSGVIEAAQSVTSDQGARDRFVQAAAVKWADLLPALEFEAKERKEARAFADTMTSTGGLWRQIGYGALIAILSLLIVGGGGFVFWSVLFTPDGFDASTRAWIIEIIKAILVLVVGFFFGSSTSSRSKDAQLADAAKRVTPQ